MAAKLGRTVAECQRDVTQREFVEFSAYYRLHPWDNEWQQAAYIAATIINATPFRKGPFVKYQDLLRPVENSPELIEASNQAIWANVKMAQEREA